MSTWRREFLFFFFFWLLNLGGNLDYRLQLMNYRRVRAEFCFTLCNEYGIQIISLAPFFLQFRTAPSFR